MNTVSEALAGATALHRSGRLNEAEQFYRRILALRPDQPDALRLLGMLLHQTGQTQPAAELLARAVRSRPDDPRAHEGLGRVLADLERWDEAAAALGQAAALAPESAEISFLLSQVHARQDRPAEALAALEACLRKDPAHARAGLALARAYRALGRRDEAASLLTGIVARQPEAHDALHMLAELDYEAGHLSEAERRYEEATRLAPTDARAWLGLGRARLAQHRTGPAGEAFRRALQAEPENPFAALALARIERAEGLVETARARLAPLLHSNPDDAALQFEMGATLQLLGERDEGERLLRAAATGQPAHAEAWRLLASARKYRTEDGSPDEEAIQRLLEDRTLDDTAKIQLHYALGKIRDDEGRYAEAFTAYAAANALQQREERLDRRELAGFVDAAIEAFPGGAAGESRRGSDSVRPIFVVGMPRSGTTLIEQILASHPDVHGAGELRTISELFNRTLGAAGVDGCLAEAVAGLDQATLAGLAAEYLAELDRLGAGAAQRVVDKMPMNLNYLGFVRLLFPNAHIVHCTRDPLDNCLSLYFGYFEPRLYCFNDLEDIAFAYAQYRRLMHHWRSLPEPALHEAAYESLVAAPEREIRALLQALDLPWDERCLDFHANRKAVRTLSVWQVREPIYTRSVGRAQHYAPWIAPLRDVLAEYGVLG